MNAQYFTRGTNLNDIDIYDFNSNFFRRENWDDFQKFHNEQTAKVYKVFEEQVKKYDLKKNHKDRLLSLAGIPNYGGDLRVSDLNVKEKLHDFLHHGLADYLPSFDEFHFYFVTIVDDRWIYSFDKPVGKFYDIRDRVQRVLTAKGAFSAFGVVELDVQKNSDRFKGKRALTAHAHLLLWQRKKVPAKTIENSLQHHFSSEATERAVHVSKVKYHENIFKIASYISKVPPGAKLRWVQGGSKGDFTKQKLVTLSPKEVIRLMEIYSEMHVNSLFIGIGKKGKVAKELKKAIKSQFTQWHKEQVDRDKGQLNVNPYSSRGIYLDQTRDTWAKTKKKYGFKDMAPSELIYVR